MTNFVEELRWRGMLKDIVPGTEEQLLKGCVCGYIGFDPSADSLHVGNLSQIMTLIHFQRAGHKPLALVGGATGMIGDPSGKSQERNLLSKDTLQCNLACIQYQLGKFLNFNCGANSAEIVNNHEWFKNYLLLDFLRSIGKCVTVNYMMAKDSVKSRLQSETGISFTEFSYQLMQGYDFYHLWKHKNCLLQMGGADQWGNMLSGIQLIRKKDSGIAFALTTELLKKANGTKFGKTEDGAIWLDANKTSAYRFYQFWLNTSDVDAKKLVRIFTLWDKKTIEVLEQEHDQATHLRLLQKRLAKDITIRVHAQQAYEQALRASEFFFGNTPIDFLKQLNDTAILELFSGVPNFKINLSAVQMGTSISNLLTTQAAVFPSKGAAKKLIQGGGLLINKSKVTTDLIFSTDMLINGKYLVVQKGKKNFFLLTFV